MTPPLLFREVWQQPPHTGSLDDENRRITQQAVTNPDLELRLYGTDARNIQAAEHNGIPDRWTGFTAPRRRADMVAQNRLPRSDGTDEDAMEDAYGESARPARGH